MKTAVIVLTLIIMAFVNTLLASCSSIAAGGNITLPAEEEIEKPVPSPQPTPSVEPSTLPTSDISKRNDEALKEWDAAHEYPIDEQKNISIDELYEKFDREIVGSYQACGYTVDIERIYKDFISENGIVLARFYFDKPILSGEVGGVKQINAMFDKEATGFFYGTENAKHHTWGSYDTFDWYVTRDRVYFGDTLLENWVLENSDKQILYDIRSSISTTVTYLKESIISMRADAYWRVGLGHSYQAQYGSNFDLETGEFLPVSRFVGNDLEDFKQLVTKTLYENVDESGSGYPTNSLVEMFSERQVDYEFSDYDYYFDGTHIFLILPEMNYYALSLILQLPGTYSPAR